MRSKKTPLIAIYISMGLSLCFLNSCAPTNSGQPSSISPFIETAAKDTLSQNKLKALHKSIDKLELFNSKIEIKDNKIVNKINYQEAQQIVSGIATAYREFETSLSDNIKKQIKFEAFNPQIKKILDEQSSERKILADLASGKANKSLFNESTYFKAITEQNEQQFVRLATKKMLENFFNEVTGLSKLSILVQSPPSSSSPNSTSKANESNSKDWILPSINIGFSIIILFFLIPSFNRILTLSKVLRRKNTHPTEIISGQPRNDEEGEALPQKSILQSIQNYIQPSTDLSLFEEQTNYILKELDLIKANTATISSTDLPSLSQSIQDLLNEIRIEVESVSTTQLPLLGQSILRLLNEIRVEVESVSTTHMSSNEDISGLLNNFKSEIKLSSNDVSKLQDKLSSEEKKVTEILQTILNKIESNVSNPLSLKVNELTIENNILSESIKKHEAGLEENRISISELNNQLKEFESDNIDLRNERDNLKREISQLSKNTTKQAQSDNTVGIKWNDIITAYQESPENILQYSQIKEEVMEDETHSYARRKNIHSPVILTSNDSSEGYYIISVENDFLLFPKEHAITSGQQRTAKALFKGYKNSIERFKLKMPARVIQMEPGKWKMEEQGLLEYDEIP